MSDIFSADHRDLFALITLVCYVALVFFGLIAILDGSHKSNESVSRERQQKRRGRPRALDLQTNRSFPSKG
jgi:hypothetical protein